MNNLKDILQLEIIDIDDDLKRLSKKEDPQYILVIGRIRDAMGRCVHLLNGTDVTEFCCYSSRGGFE